MISLSHLVQLLNDVSQFPEYIFFVFHRLGRGVERTGVRELGARHQSRDSWASDGYGPVHLQHGHLNDAHD